MKANAQHAHKECTLMEKLYAANEMLQEAIPENANSWSRYGRVNTPR